MLAIVRGIWPVACESAISPTQAGASAYDRSEALRRLWWQLCRGATIGDYACTSLILNYASVRSSAAIRVASKPWRTVADCAAAVFARPSVVVASGLWRRRGTAVRGRATWSWVTPTSSGPLPRTAGRPSSHAGELKPGKAPRVWRGAAMLALLIASINVGQPIVPRLDRWAMAMPPVSKLRDGHHIENGPCVRGCSVHLVHRPASCRGVLFRLPG